MMIDTHSFPCCRSIDLRVSFCIGMFFQEESVIFQKATRRTFFSQSASLIGASALASTIAPRGRSATTKGPQDFVIVEGHRDIWEQSGRTRLKEEAQHWPIANFIAPRLIEGGVTVVIMPAGGDSLEERDEQDEMRGGSMRVLGLILSDLDKTSSKVSIIRTKATSPRKTNCRKVTVFLDIQRVS